MRRRLYFMLPDVAVGRNVLDELLLARIDERHIHFLSRRDSLPPDLPEASFLQKTDFFHALRIGGFLGAAAGLTAGAVLWFIPPENMVLEPVIVLVVGVVGGVLGAWFSSMVGASVPNTTLRRFQPQIDAGNVLLMVDVPFRRVEEIRDRVASHHPEALWNGVAPQIPAFP